MATRSMSAVSREECERLHAELLRLGARGAHRAVPRRLLAETFGSDRRLRHVMSAAPELGVAVGSTEDGYFAIDSVSDLDAAIASLQSRTSELYHRMSAYQSIRNTDSRFSERLF
jgi:hypothetical protein